MSDWINHQALVWAWHCDKINSTAERAVLVSYAKHCDKRGYSGVSVRNIASTWHQHRITIARARDRLISARFLHKTKKRRGQTRQTKVYRLPKIAWESGLKSNPLKKAKGRERVEKVSHKGCIKDHEERIKNTEEHSKEQRHSNELSHSIADAMPLIPPSFLSFYSEQEQKMIDAYHRILCTNNSRWKPITKHTQAVSNALALHDLESFSDLCQSAASENGDCVIPNQPTLVRLVWDNY
jgi:hypothetical protein